MNSMSVPQGPQVSPAKHPDPQSRVLGFLLVCLQISLRYMLLPLERNLVGKKNTLVRISRNALDLDFNTEHDIFRRSALKYGGHIGLHQLASDSEF